MDIIYDTETTGKLDFRAPPGAPQQPSIVQLAALLVEGVTVRASLNVILIPTTPMQEEAARVHGIGPDVIERCGVPQQVGLAMFNNLLKKADRQIAHNINFDHPVVKTAYLRLGAPTDFLDSVPKACTMLSTTSLLKLPAANGRPGYKWPSLMEAYKALVDEAGFDGAHDAMADVVACWKIAQYLERHGIPLGT